MGEILSMGVTHFPGLAGTDEHMASTLQRTLQDHGLPDQYRHPESWPEAMRQEYGADAGLSAARRHREALVTQFRKARRLLEDFKPDFVVVFGDDQYENFTEDRIPPSVYWRMRASRPGPGRRFRGLTSGGSPRTRPLSSRDIASARNTWPAACWRRGSTAPTPIGPCITSGAMPF